MADCASREVLPPRRARTPPHTAADAKAIAPISATGTISRTQIGLRPASGIQAYEKGHITKAMIAAILALRARRSGSIRRASLSSAAPSATLELVACERLEYELTPDAIDLGLDAALPPMIELESKIGEFGRGERI
jgi:hypothetical protein